MDGLSHNTGWKVEHGVDGPLVMVSVFSVWGTSNIGKVPYEVSVHQFQKKNLKLMAQ